MIDTHTHLHYSGRLPDEPAGITAEKLVETMSERSIDISVLLPMETPELTSGFCLTEWVIEAAEQFPEQLVPFMHFDPRKPRCVDLIEHFNAHPLVRGFGELVDPLPFDDPRRLKIYDKCGELGLPLVFYGDKNASVDEVGLPRLRKCLRDFPDTIFIGHGPRWWNAISAEDDAECGYPDGEVVPGGAADRFLQEYENMYADISARSGYNALMRDPEFTLGFIERNWRKLFFATDYL
ncbi:MAG: amidohydrolase family protein, partial [Planctomycetes bacterium]|nr:amidohydrolase family protein [Planctomycetota bacterium]